MALNIITYMQVLINNRSSINGFLISISVQEVFFPFNFFPFLPRVNFMPKPTHYEHEETWFEEKVSWAEN